MQEQEQNRPVPALDPTEKAPQTKPEQENVVNLDNDGNNEVKRDMQDDESLMDFGSGSGGGSAGDGAGA